MDAFFAGGDLAMTILTFQLKLLRQHSKKDLQLTPKLSAEVVLECEFRYDPSGKDDFPLAA